MKGHIRNRNATFKKSIRAQKIRMWLAALIAQIVAKRKKGKKTERKGCWDMCFALCCSLLKTNLSSEMGEKWHRSKHFAKPMSGQITHWFASPPRAGNQNTSLKHWPQRNASRRQHWSWMGPDEPICLSALDRPAGTRPRVREDKVGDPCPTAPACLHFPQQCMTVCVSGRVSLCPCIHMWNPRYQERVMGLWTLKHSEAFGHFFCEWLI